MVKRAFIAAFGLIVLLTTAAPADTTKPVSVQSTAVTDRLVICTGSCNLQSAYVTAGSTPGFLMIFRVNAATIPADGAVTPDDCIPAFANQTTGLDYGTTTVPIGSTGVSVVFSTTGCFTLTKSATAAFIKGRKIGGS